MRMRKSVYFATRLLLLAILFYPLSHVQAQTNPPTLVVVVEGLRHEHVTRSAMPNLYKLSKKGVSLEDHHAVFPTSPSANVASIITGSNPTGHGILGNTLVDAERRHTRGFDVTSASDLRRFETESKEDLLTAPRLGAIAAASNKRFQAFCATDSGIAYLLDPENAHVAPSELSGVEERNKWAVNEYLETDFNSAMTILWLSGTDESLRELRELDAHIGRIVKAHRKLKVAVNILITSSGNKRFSSGDSRRVTDLFVQHKLKESHESLDVFVKDGSSIYVEGSNLEIIRRIVERLQVTEWVGAIYTQQIRRTHPEGKAKGVLSFQSVYMDHKRSPDIFFELALQAAPTSSEQALHIPLIAVGPNIKFGLRSTVPSSNSDLGPTLCYLMGVDPPESMTGRIIHEIIRGGPKPDEIDVLRRRHGAQVDLDSLTYRLFMSEFTVDEVDYFHAIDLQRIRKN
ncbi:MAG: alkaline phosphatase family protein [Candidatus Hydrogenedentota bacterium]